MLKSASQRLETPVKHLHLCLMYYVKLRKSVKPVSLTYTYASLLEMINMQFTKIYSSAVKLDTSSHTQNKGQKVCNNNCRGHFALAIANCEIFCRTPRQKGSQGRFVSLSFYFKDMSP